MSDLQPYPEVKVFPKLLNDIRINPGSDDNFEALFHYNSIKDGGPAACMRRDSFHFFFSEKPLILYNRYIQTGDDRILSFCRDVLNDYDPDSFSGEGRSREEKQKIVTAVIRKLQDNDNSERGKLFLKNIKDCMQILK